MISAVLSAAIALSVPAGSEDSAPRNDVAVVLVGARDIRALNPTPCDRVLLVGERAGGPLAAVLLPAGSDATYPLPAGGLDGWFVELAFVGPAGLERTGPIAIEPVPVGSTLVVTAAAEHACSFALAASALLAPSSLSSNAGAASTSSCGCSAVAALHVPVVVPSEESGPSRPPKLDEDPLPVL